MFSYPVLVELIREPGSAARLDVGDWEVVISQARMAGLFILLEDYLRAKDSEVCLPEKVVQIIRAEQCVAQKQVSSARWEAGKLVRILSELGLKPIFLKGAAYILSGVEAARGRLLSDIDILVPVGALNDIESRLVANGWRESPLDEYDKQYFREWMHEIPPFTHLKSNITLDIHHTILALTAKSNPNAEVLLLEAVPTAFEGANVLCPVDMVLHSAAHLFSEGELEMGLRGLIDLERLLLEFAGKDSNFWDRLIERAKLHQLERPLYYALHYCKLILKLNVPGWVLQHISDRPSMLLLKWMDFLYLRALMPDHPKADQLFTSFARLLLYIRGHYLRMPIRILVPHLIRKSWKKRQRRKQTQQVVAQA